MHQSESGLDGSEDWTVTMQFATGYRSMLTMFVFMTTGENYTDVVDSAPAHFWWVYIVFVILFGLTPI